MERNSEKTSPWAVEIEALRERNLYRWMPPVCGLPGRTTRVNGKDVLNFSSNNYLGLAGHQDVIRAGMQAAARYGAGATASRLIAGNTEIHSELESVIAGWKHTEAAIVFGSGYQANVGVLSSLMCAEDLIVSDRLNHASIIDGCRLSRAQVGVYPHLDLDAVEDQLKRTGFRRKLLVTESVFSMDGDRAPLRDLQFLCRRWNALFMVDEAHAAGVYGPQGRGLAAELSVVPDIQMGTLGKAVGSGGAYVAGERLLIEMLVNTARSLIYTTAAPPAVLGSALEGVRIITSEEGDRRRAALRANMEQFRDLLARSAIPGAPDRTSHIVPIRIGDSGETMRVSSRCFESGLFAHGIRYPTVPEGSARIRFTLMSDHTAEDLQTAVSLLRQAMEYERCVEPQAGTRSGAARR
jgi:8-amino-7-oxononanoate synthase